MLISGLALVCTSLILYIVPPGRVAYWANWSLLGLSKEEWTGIHTNLGFLLVLSSLLHIYYNWRPIVNYLKNSMKEVRVFTREFNLALIICIATAAGTYFEIPPFSTVLELGASFKDKGSDKYGEPPYGHAELSSLKIFSRRMGLDLNKAEKALRDAGIKFKNSEQNIKDIAADNNVTPKKIYSFIKDSKMGESTESDGKLPLLPPPGTGRIVLSDLCDSYDLDCQSLIGKLKEQSIEASAGQNLKTIADNNGIDPHQLYDTILKITEK